MPQIITRVFKVTLSLAAFFTLSAANANFDHSYKDYERVLKNHVISKGPQTLVKYKKLKSSDEGLKSVLSQLTSVKRSEFEGWTSNQRLAFLINSYNAFTLKLIIDHYPVKSIKDILIFGMI